MNIRKAAAINAGGKWMKVVLTVLVNAVLARILTQYDYGVVAVLTVFSTFFATLSDMGIGAAIIQKKELEGKDIDSLFTYSVYIALGLSAVFAACVLPVALFYKDSVYVAPMLMLTLSVFFNTVNMVPNGILNRDKKFIVIAVRTVAVYMVGAAVAIVLALKGWGYYSLVIQTILTAVLQFAWNWFGTRPKFTARPSRESLRKVGSYSSWQFAFNLVNYFSRNLDNLLTGKFMGETNLGNYNRAYSLMLFPVINLTGVISPVLHPILSDYQNDFQAIYSRYVRLVRFLFCCGIFISGAAYLAGDEIIGIMYGEKWKASVRCFQLLAIAIIPQMINSSAGAIFQSIGNTRLLFVSTCINTAVTVAAIICGIFLGGSIESLAIWVAGSYVFHFFCAFWFLIKRGFGYSMGAFFKALWKEWVSLAAMVAAIFVYVRFVPEIGNIVLSAAAKIGYLAVLFAALMFATKEHKLFLQILKVR